jgi:16S rRNA (adenine1518-N6/adenine1519-N6)-dimethyltransferase
MKTSDLLKKHNFKFKKRFGQNFITDLNLLERIADAGNISKEDVVLEIGPGAGTLTKVLAEKAGHVIALEIDRTLIPILEEQFKNYSNITVVNEDALKVNFDEVVKNYCNEISEYKIIANLPYYITTPLLFNALERAELLSEMVVMVQKEVGERLQASPGTKDYGALTLMANYYAEVQYMFTVSKKLFSPEPEVDSAIVKFKKHDKRPLNLKEEEVFKKIVKASFSQRRKTFLNSIKTLELDKEKVIFFLNEAGYGEKVRGEELPLKVYLEMGKYFSEK